ncbi:hypothetical protein NIES4101_52030 [Calothrix sp. NIES-4101]|nr:hypothetical protein NIES4101_52030 [Calothrix sp. NIES-4101]
MFVTDLSDLGLSKTLNYIILDAKLAMAFIKIQNVVINTSYVAAVKLDSRTSSGEKSVSVLIATPKFPLFQLESISQNLYHNEWIEFTGQAASALQDYFTSFNNVIDLSPQYQESSVM